MDAITFCIIEAFQVALTSQTNPSRTAQVKHELCRGHGVDVSDFHTRDSGSRPVSHQQVKARLLSFFRDQYHSLPHQNEELGSWTMKRTFAQFNALRGSVCNSSLWWLMLILKIVPSLTLQVPVVAAEVHLVTVLELSIISHDLHQRIYLICEHLLHGRVVETHCDAPLS